MIPLYGFLEGDTMGLLIFAYENETVAELRAKLIDSAKVRVKPIKKSQLVYRGKVLDEEQKIFQAGFEALDRFDVVKYDS